MIWSGSDPDLLFCHCGLKLWSYNVATRAYTLFKGFSTLLPPGQIAQMSKSLDDNTFAVTRRGMIFRQRLKPERKHRTKVASSAAEKRRRRRVHAQVHAPGP